MTKISYHSDYSFKYGKGLPTSGWRIASLPVKGLPSKNILLERGGGGAWGHVPLLPPPCFHRLCPTGTVTVELTFIGDHANNNIDNVKFDSELL